MSTKRIGIYAANRIARKIADKAFEKAFKPFIADEDEIAKMAFKKVSDEFSFDELVAFGFARRMFKATITIKQNTCNDLSIDVDTIHGDVDDFIMLDDTNPVIVTSSDLYELAFELKQRSATLCTQKQNLIEEIGSQISGKTSAQVLKAWPDAEEILTIVCGKASLPAKRVVIEPLDVLLAKYIQPKE